MGFVLAPSWRRASVITDAEPVMKETTHWYMPLGDFQERLEEWIDSREGWKPNVLGQVKSWLDEGLKDRAMTRDLPWGVKIPEEIAEEAGIDASDKVFYVWFDAPIGYISATKEWAEKRGEPEAWRTYWQDEETRLVHFVGKDNIVFHCLIFPAMLMAHGEFVLPENVPANEFLNLEGRKLSTSRGWAVWLHEYLEDFDPDLLRYALATTLPETKDADFSWENFQNRVNSELADVLGNFVNRTMTFATRYFDGHVPPLAEPRPVDNDVLQELRDFPETIGAAYENYRIREAVFETIQLARLGNKYFNDTEPWHTRKSDPQSCANTIHVSLQLCAALGVLMEPVLPFTADRLRRMLRMKGVRPSTPSDPQLEFAVSWNDAAEPLLDAGHQLGDAEILFEKIEDDVIEQQVEKLARAAAASATDGEDAAAEEPYAPPKEEIVFSDFEKLDLRIGYVTVAERVPKSDKLIRVQVDLGFEQRQVLAGVAEQMEPEVLVGRRLVVVANLKPRKLFGLESQGMVLMAEDREGNLHPVTAPDAEPGSTVA